MLQFFVEGRFMDIPTPLLQLQMAPCAPGYFTNRANICERCPAKQTTVFPGMARCISCDPIDGLHCNGGDDIYNEKGYYGFINKSAPFIHMRRCELNRCGTTEASSSSSMAPARCVHEDAQSWVCSPVANKLQVCQFNRSGALCTSCPHHMSATMDSGECVSTCYTVWGVLGLLSTSTLWSVALLFVPDKGGLNEQTILFYQMCATIGDPIGPSQPHVLTTLIGVLGSFMNMRPSLPGMCFYPSPNDEGLIETLLFVPLIVAYLGVLYSGLVKAPTWLVPCTSHHVLTVVPAWLVPCTSHRRCCCHRRRLLPLWNKIVVLAYGMVASTLIALALSDDLPGLGRRFTHDTSQSASAAWQYLALILAAILPLGVWWLPAFCAGRFNERGPGAKPQAGSKSPSNQQVVNSGNQAPVSTTRRSGLSEAGANLQRENREVYTDTPMCCARKRCGHRLFNVADFWNPLLMLFRLLLTVVVLVCQDRRLRIMVQVFMCGAATMLHVMTMPFKTAAVNTLVICHWSCLTCYALVSMLLDTAVDLNDMSPTHKATTRVLSAMQTAFFFFPLCSTVVYRCWKWRQPDSPPATAKGRNVRHGPCVDWRLRDPATIAHGNVPYQQLPGFASLEPSWTSHGSDSAAGSNQQALMAAPTNRSMLGGGGGGCAAGAGVGARAASGVGHSVRAKSTASRGDGSAAGTGAGAGAASDVGNVLGAKHTI